MRLTNGTVHVTSDSTTRADGAPEPTGLELAASGLDAR
jgi:hypothetical protein